MEVSSAGKREYGGKGRWVKYWARLGCWISPCYGPFLLGLRFETYEPFISLIFNFVSGRGKPRILNQRISGHTYTHTHPNTHTCVISGFRREVNENGVLLGHYAASSGNFLPVLACTETSPLNMGPIGCPEKSVRDYRYLLLNNTEERSSPIFYSWYETNRIVCWPRMYYRNVRPAGLQG
jgi:hypothetical protein